MNRVKHDIPLGVRTKRLCVVDYYTIPWEDCPSETPHVVLIASRELATGYSHLFGWHLEAELAGIAPDALHANAAELERRTLLSFHCHLQARPKTRWVHWGLAGADYGFPALAHRAAVRGVAEFAPPAHLHDLSEFLKNEYGDDYVDHHRLTTLIRLNGVNDHQLLPLAALTAAFRDGAFRAMAASLQRKVYCVEQILALHLAGRLQVQRPAAGLVRRELKGCGWVACARIALGVARRPSPRGPRRPDPPAREPPANPESGGQPPPQGPGRELPAWIGEHFQRHQYRLMKMLWGRGEVPITDVQATIYGKHAAADEALDKVKDRANEKLAKLNLPFEITTRRSEVFVLRKITA